MYKKQSKTFLPYLDFPFSLKTKADKWNSETDLILTSPEYFLQIDATIEIHITDVYKRWRFLCFSDFLLSIGWFRSTTSQRQISV